MNTTLKRSPPLPPVAFAAHPVTGATLMLRRGRRGYVVLTTRLGPDELNPVFGVTACQARALLTRALFGGDRPSGNPATYTRSPSYDSMTQHGRKHHEHNH